ncbi:MAG: tetratricopeptide repeat protein [Deltaproteobacteria bacterium]|nr:tetratricopeptide repeat protein [Deltaproteobacteria bacterium]
MDTETLRGELERLFELDGLIELSRDILGLKPDDVGGTGSKAAFARALVERCAEMDAVETLFEVAEALKGKFDPKALEAILRAPPARDELHPSTSLGPYTISRKLADGPCASVYVAQRDGKDFVLKVLSREATRSPQALLRFSSLCRLAGRVHHEGVPSSFAFETIDGLPLVSYEHVDGQTMAARSARSGPMHINEARAILRGLLDAMAALHEQRVVHGNLKLENVLTCRGEAGKPRIMLLDPGFDRLRTLRGPATGSQDVFVVIGSARCVAPEQIRGERVTARSDVYSFGAVMYEILTGKPLFTAKSGVEFAVAHLTASPMDPSAAAPRGWVTKEVGAFISSLIARDPSARPKDARAVIEEFEKLGRAAEARRIENKITDDELGKRMDALVVAPDDDKAAAALDAAVEEGGDAAKIAEAFVMAADQIEGDEASRNEVRKSLLFRAARLYEQHLKNLEEAEKAYAWIVEIDPADDLANAALETVRKQLGKYEEVVEMLLGRVELSSDSDERAEAMAEIGRIYAEELEDSAQAVVAYAKAFSEAPWHAEYADAIEKRVGNDMTALGDAIAMLAEATRGELPPEHKNRIFLRLANWYLTKVGRADAALPCYQAVIATDPNSDGALEGMANLFRTTQQYTELGQVLLRRAECAPVPAKSRDYKCEAAELLEQRLNEPAKAKELYEQVLAADPGHIRAGDALLKVYEKDGNTRGTLGILERRAEALRGKDRAIALVKIAELYEKLKEYSEAVKRYDLALTADDTNQDALKALEKIYTKSSRFQELLGILDKQAACAATPRQRIDFYERIAKIWETEFLDHVQAALALERIMEIDPAHQEGLAALARHYRALNRWEDVVGVYERHLNIVTDKTQRLDLLLTRARLLADQIGAPERAMKTYEEVLEIDPQHAGALEAVASLREQSGDAQAAIKAIEALAAKAATPREKAEHYLRAAKMLETRGDRDGAIERYRTALDVNPRESAASSALRAIYVERGDAQLAMELIAREIEYADSKSVKAKLCAEIAKLARDKLKDMARAESAAKMALGHDESQIDALLILGDMAFESERFVEAQHHLDDVVNRLDLLPKEIQVRTLRRFVESLARTGSAEKALTACDKLLELAGEDLETVQVVAKIVFDHGEPKKAFQLYQDILDRAGNKLVGSDRSLVLYRHGEAARKAGDAITAVKSLQEAADMDPSSADPLAALAKVYEAKGDWEEVIRIKNRRLDVAAGDERVDLLCEIGEICAAKLNDRTRAAKSLQTALEERPDDRKLLTRLMQLHSENKDWSKLVEVVLKLADFVDDKKQKAKYFHTASMVTAKQLGDTDKAIEFLDKVLELDPSLDKALEEAIELRREKSDWDGVDKLLKTRLERATERNDRDTILKTFDELAEMYQKKLGWTSEAIDAYEAAQMVEPENTARNEILANLYASNPAEYLDKAVAAQRILMRQNAGKPEPYKLLRKLYTEAKRADGAWCLCQALSVLNLAEPDEDRFFRRMRSDTAAVAKDCLIDEDWVKTLMHESADPILTAILATIEPAILATRADTLENLGYDARYAIDLALHPYPISQTIYYAAGVLGIQAPPTFQNINDQGGINFLHAQIPSIVLGRAAFEIELPQQQAAYMVARHLTYYRPGLYVRHLVPTGTGLKAWVFAAIKMNAPQFPISADLEGPVNENLKALNAHLMGPVRERLASLVSKLIQSGGALDLKGWIAAVDLTADRAGFIVAHDLEVATEMIKLSDEASSPVTHKDRLKELVLYSVSEQYFAIRKKLQVAIDS